MLECLPGERQGQTHQIDHENGSGQDQAPAQTAAGRGSAEPQIVPSEAGPAGDQHKQHGRDYTDQHVPTGCEQDGERIRGREHHDGQEQHPHGRTRIADVRDARPTTRRSTALFWRTT